MAQGVIWSHRAEANLRAIYEFIAHDSEVYAWRFVQRLVQSTEEHLPNNRHMGRAVPEFVGTPLHTLREIVYRGYRIIYDPDGANGITVLAVINGRMEIGKQFELE